MIHFEHIFMAKKGVIETLHENVDTGQFREKIMTCGIDYP